MQQYGVDELMQMLNEGNDDIKICSVCATPFIPYHSRQKTCGSEECKRIHHNEYLKEYFQDPEVIEKKKASNRAYARRKRAERKAMRGVLKNIDTIVENTKKQEEFDKKISGYGTNYGQYQREKILANVPKINTEL